MFRKRVKSLFTYFSPAFFCLAFYADKYRRQDNQAEVGFRILKMSKKVDIQHEIE